MDICRQYLVSGVCSERSRWRGGPFRDNHYNNCVFEGQQVSDLHAKTALFEIFLFITRVNFISL